MEKKGFFLSEENFFDMLSFLVSSAFLMSEGEESEEFYPSFRLMDAAYRLANLVDGEFDENSWVKKFSTDGEEGLDLMGIDNEAFGEFLLSSTVKLAKEMKNRARA